MRNSLEGLKSKIDNALGRTVASVSRNYGENHVTWLRDENGNTIRASAVLREVFPKDSHPRSNAESALTRAIGHTGQPSDVGGHIIGHQFQGRDSGDFNIVPQHGTVITPADSPNLNQGAYSKMENELADWIGHEMEVRLDVEVLDYVDGRPSTFGVRYEVIDPATGKRVHSDRPTFENGPGQEFSRFASSEMQHRIDEVNGRI